MSGAWRISKANFRMKNQSFLFLHGGHPISFAGFFFCSFNFLNKKTTATSFVFYLSVCLAMQFIKCTDANTLLCVKNTFCVKNIYVTYHFRFWYTILWVKWTVKRLNEGRSIRNTENITKRNDRKKGIRRWRGKKRKRMTYEGSLFFSLVMFMFHV